MTKPKILVQLDSDSHASVFDAVVAVDGGVEHLLQYGSVTRDQVRDLVHGAMFTRGVAELSSTAIFIGGSDVSAGEEILRGVVDSFFGPIRVSVMLDASGANTTAAGAIVAAARHLDLSKTEATVLAATGPVGQRVVQLLATAGARVRVVSRSMQRATELCQEISQIVRGCHLRSVEATSPEQMNEALRGAQLVVSAGAAGIELLPESAKNAYDAARVLIDLNAVPPVGIAHIKPTDHAKEQDGTICYGAIGVGNIKMKIHKEAIRRLFQRNDYIFDIDSIYQLGIDIEAR